MGKIVDAIGPAAEPNAPEELREEARSSIRSMTFALGGVFLVGAVASFGRVALLKLAGERLVARLRKDTFRSLLAKDVSYFDAHRSGDMLSKISADTVVLSKAFFECSAAARSGISAVGGTGLLLYISPPLTGLSLAVMPLVGVGAVLYGRYVKRLSKQAQAALGEAVGSASERLSSVRTVKLCNGEEREQKAFDKQVDKIYGISVDMAMASGVNMGSVTLGINAAFLAVLYYGGTLVLAQQLSVGDLAAFSLYSLFVGGSATGLATAYGDLMQAAGAADRVFALTHPSDAAGKEAAAAGGGKATAGSDGTPLRPEGLAQGVLEFSNVEFAYPTRPNAQVLRDFSLSVEPGETV